MTPCIQGERKKMRISLKDPGALLLADRDVGRYVLHPIPRLSKLDSELVLSEVEGMAR